MITITGATGALNGATLRHLLERVPPHDITVVARDLEKAAALADLGVDVRAGDYAEPDGLRAAFEGADQLLLVSSNDPGTDTVALHRNAIEAAAAAGVGRVLYTSHQGADVRSPFPPAVVHARTEALLAESGLPWTALRNGFYAHSIEWLLGPWQHTGAASVPADGPVSWTARDDAAEAAAAILLLDEPIDGPVTLTADDAPSFSDLAAFAAEASGSPVRFETVDEDTWLHRAVAAGLPEFRARFTLGIYLAAAQGRFAGTGPLLGELLGRRPRSARDVVADMVGGS